MRKLIAFSLPALLILGLCGSTYEPTTGTYATETMKGRGPMEGVKVSASISANPSAPTMVAKADLGKSIEVALSASLEEGAEAGGNAEEWAVVSQDTTSDLADGKHVLIPDLAGLGWSAYDGDVLHYSLRVYDGLGLDVTDTGSIVLRYTDLVAPEISVFAATGYDSSGSGGAYRVHLEGTSDEAGDWVVRASKTIAGIISATPTTIAEDASSLEDTLDTGFAPFDGRVYLSMTVTDASGNESNAAAASISVVREEPSPETLTLDPIALSPADSSGSNATVTVTTTASDSPWQGEWCWKENYDGTWSDVSGASFLNEEVVFTVSTGSATSNFADADSLWVRVRGRYPGDDTYTDWDRDVIDYDRAVPAVTPTLAVGGAAIDTLGTDDEVRLSAWFIPDVTSELDIWFTKGSGDTAGFVSTDTTIAADDTLKFTWETGESPVTDDVYTAYGYAVADGETSSTVSDSDTVVRASAGGSTSTAIYVFSQGSTGYTVTGSNGDYTVTWEDASAVADTVYEIDTSGTHHVIDVGDTTAVSSSSAYCWIELDPDFSWPLTAGGDDDSRLVVYDWSEYGTYITPADVDTAYLVLSESTSVTFDNGENNQVVICGVISSDFMDMRKSNDFDTSYSYYDHDATSSWSPHLSSYGSNMVTALGDTIQVSTESFVVDTHTSYLVTDLAGQSSFDGMFVITGWGDSSSDTAQLDNFDSYDDDSPFFVVKVEVTE